MGRTWTIAAHTLREAVRARIVVTAVVLIVLLVAWTPMAVRTPSATLTSAVQTFLSWSMTLLGVLLSFLAIFLGALSISQEMTQRQIYILMAKPIPRWQYVLGKWAGVVAVLTGLLVFAGAGIYGFAKLMAFGIGAWVWAAGMIAAVPALGLLWFYTLRCLLLRGSRPDEKKWLWLVTAASVLWAAALACEAFRDGMPGGLAWLRYVLVPAGLITVAALIIHRRRSLRETGALTRWSARLAVTGAAVSLVCMSLYQARPVLDFGRYQDRVDLTSLHYEVLTARASVPLYAPNFMADVEKRFQQLVEEGRYSRDLSMVEADKAKVEILLEMQQNWRSVPPGGYTRFQFRDVRVQRSPNEAIQLRYKAKGMGYAPDEVLHTYWVFGNPADAEPYAVARADVMDRFHVFSVPATTVSPDGTLHLVVQNLEDRRQNHHGATISFESGRDSFEVLYVIGTFGGNLARTLCLIWCRVVCLAGVSVFAATLFSYPVACLIAFIFYALAISGDYVTSALSFGAPGTGPLGPARYVLEPLMKGVFWLWPQFKHYNAIPQFVDGRNVSLVWDFQGLGKLVLGLTTMFLLAACLVFRRRQVAELSV